MNIDKDIEILKEKLKILNDTKLKKTDQLERELQAISNVLSELEEKKKQIKVLENNNRLLDISLGRELQTYKDTNIELATYKKIAENLANTLSKEIFNKLGIKPRIEDLIEVARKEVENEK